MRKVFILFVSIVLLVSFVPAAVCESFDLSSMSDEELIKLIDDANKELSYRSGTIYGTWFDYGMGQTLPNPDIVFGRQAIGDTGVKVNKDTWFADEIDNVTPDEFELYIQACDIYGYNLSKERTTSAYKAEDFKGNNIRIMLYGTTLMVKIN